LLFGGKDSLLQFFYIRYRIWIKFY